MERDTNASKRRSRIARLIIVSLSCSLGFGCVGNENEPRTTAKPSAVAPTPLVPATTQESKAPEGQTIATQKPMRDLSETLPPSSAGGEMSQVSLPRRVNEDDNSYSYY